MLSKSKVHIALKKYFDQKGRVLSPQEYARETDTPVRVQSIKALFGSWTKMEKLIMADEKARSSNGLNVDALIKERNAAAFEAARQWKEAGENQRIISSQKVL